MGDLAYLLQKFFSGSATREEQRQLFSLLSSDDGEIRQQYKGIFKQNVESELLFISKERSEEILLKIKALTDAHAAPTQSGGSSQERRIWMRRGIVAAAALLFAALGVYYWIRLTQPARKMVNPVVKVLPGNDEEWTQWNNVSTKSVKKILSDGSAVYLYAGGQLKYKKKFGKQRRELYLTGRAKFVVARDARRPFIVFSGNISTTALGTVFYVDHSRKEDAIVKLWRGKVIVKDTKHIGHDIYLSPGETCRFNGISLSKLPLNPVVKVKRNPPDQVQHHSFADDTTYDLRAQSVVFKNAKLSVVFDKIAQLYNIEVAYSSIQDSVMTRSVYSGVFDKKKISPQAALRTITNVNDLGFKQVDSISYQILPLYSTQFTSR